MKPSESKNKKNKKYKKNNNKKTRGNLWAQHFSQDLVFFLCFLFSLGFFEFLFFLSPVADENFGV